ncbi:FAD-dependent monooxygenase [Sinosporangium siamense]|uniref:FAD-dependent oxidoreductase n=1 Tax=Sinosporangium siamense TaxID=1367973 RepID=A0A919RFF8_9ACTN|nr:FAD-dependent monooxygenase [Sinosporangium siamense]GII92916.1 FAD-dependent oxidoreductase [Sinosporangium siamense]
MSDKTVTDVLIVGRGPVGMTLALLLARYGVNSVVVDPAGTEIRLSSKAVLMHGESLEILNRVEVGRTVAEQGIRLRGSRVFVRDRELRFDEFDQPDPYGYPTAVNFPQSETERLLLQQVEREQRVDLRLGVAFEGLRQRDDHVVAELSDGSQVVAQYVAGCDGARSAVRKALGLRFEGHAHDDHYLIVDIRADLPFADERRFIFHPPGGAGRTALIHPQPFSLWHLDFQVGKPPDLEAETRDGTLDQRIRSMVGKHDYEVTWSTSYVFKQLMASRFSVGRCFLVGDAAHLYAPYGARGLNSGLADADNLAWKLGMVLTGQASPALLETYHEERRSVASRHFGVTSKTAAFMAPTTRMGRWRRDVTLAVGVRIPAARSLVDAGHFYRPEGVPESRLTMLGLSGLEDLAVMPGELMPDLPVAEGSARGIRRLRDSYGTHPMVVTIQQPVGDRVVVNVRHLGGDSIDQEFTTAAITARTRVLGEATSGVALLLRPDGFISRCLPLSQLADGHGDIVGSLAETANRIYGDA